MELIEIARLEETRQACGLAEIADEARQVGGGIAGRGAPGTWVNHAVGVGLNGPVARRDIEGLIDWYTGAGVEPRLEVCPYAYPGLVKDCEELGFRLRGFETVFFRTLDRNERARPAHGPPEGLEISVVDPSDEGAVREYALVASSGFFPPERPARKEDLEVAARCARHPRTIAMTARLDGVCVGAGACEVAGEVCALFGLSVLPEYRRRGVQGALIAARLNAAAARGAQLATIGSRPGIPTERNVQRMGFTVAYTKVALVRPGEGLARMVG